MKTKLIFTFLFLATFASANNSGNSLNGLYYLSGRIDKKIMMELIDLSKDPIKRSEGSCQLAGTSNSKYKGKELGAIVLVDKSKYIEDRSLYFVRSFINECEGWLKEEYIYKKVSKSDCKKDFIDEKALQKKCIEGIK